MDVTMPQLGETVTEGTITRWFKEVGEPIAADEPLFEVSTDKVDSEVPSPSGGYVTEILVPEGETVQVGARLAVIGEAAPSPKEEAPSPPAAASPAAAPPADAPPAVASPAAAPPADAPPRRDEGAVGAGGSGAVLLSPIVRRLVTEHGLDPGSIPGTGEGGRITRSDVLAYVDRRRAAAPVTSAPPLPPRLIRRDEVLPFDNVRKRTAEHMVRSKATSAHALVVVEVDLEPIEQVRVRHRDEWRAAEGYSLTYLPFLARAACDALADFPRLNASVEGDSLVVHGAVDLAIAVDLDFEGLVAPVVRNADGKRLRQLAREIRDVATRARSRQLGPDDVVGGTFTITNPGPFGTLLTAPIINQPQVAILATDGARKRPVVVETSGADAISIHHVAFQGLTFDHRANDGAYAAAFLRRYQEIVETRDWESELT